VAVTKIRRRRRRRKPPTSAQVLAQPGRQGSDAL